MNWADTLSDEECKNIRLSQIEHYKENWNVVKELSRNNQRGLN